MNTLSERISFLLKLKSASKAELAKACGVKPPSVANWIDGRTKKLEGESLVRAAIFFACNPLWLATGIGEPFTRLDGFYLEKSSSSRAYFDYLDAKAACGVGYLNHDAPATVTRLETGVDFAQELVGNTNKSGNIKLFTAAGDSMTPTISPRDLLFVDTACKDMRGEGIYLIFHADGLVCKRLLKLGKKIRVCSDNEMHKDKDWDWTDRDETTRIIGKVVASLPLEMRRYE